MPGPVGVADAGELGVAGEQPVHERAVRRCPAPGCTTRPAGLSTTTTSSSACTTATPTVGVGPTATRLDGRRSSSSSSDLALVHPLLAGAGRPSPSTAHRAGRRRSRTASARLTSPSRATSAVEPLARPAPRGRPRSRAPASAAVPDQADDHQEDAADHDGHVGHVEHRPPLEVDEVDHPALEEPVVGAEEPVERGCPAAPPTTRPTATAPSVDVPLRAETTSTTTTTRPSAPITGPSPRPWLKAMPLLNVRWSRSVQTTSMSPVDQPLERPPLGELVEGDDQDGDRDA